MARYHRQLLKGQKKAQPMECGAEVQKGLRARPKGLVCGLQTGWLKTQGFAHIGKMKVERCCEIRN